MFQQWTLCFLVFLVALEVGGISDEVLAAFHSRIDADNDSSVSLPEMKGFVRSMRLLEAKKEDISSHLQRIDTDKDGKLQLQEVLHDAEKLYIANPTPDEYEAAKEWKVEFRTKFEAVDKNADGILEDDEIRLYLFPELNDEVITMLATSTLKRKDLNRDGKLTNLEFFKGPLEIVTEEEFQRLDKDMDNSLNLQELKSLLADSYREESEVEHVFQDSDRNQDNFLTLYEFQAAEYFRWGYYARRFDHWREHLEL